MSAGVSLDSARAPAGMRLYAIGDVHGRLDLLRQMHERIADDLGQRPTSDWRIIHLGDYVDRGPDSKGVIDLVLAAQARDPGRVLALKGNHEEGFLEFLNRPDAGGLFARFGGEDTARSYGVEINWRSAASLRASHAALTGAMPEAHLGFLKGLALSTMLGDFFFCHAGIRPTVPLAEQAPDDLVWIRDDFLRWPDLHPKVVVHGHTPTLRPELRPNRVNVDTGAFKTGLLTALAVDGSEKRLIFAEG